MKINLKEKNIAKKELARFCLLAGFILTFLTLSLASYLYAEDDYAENYSLPELTVDHNLTLDGEDATYLTSNAYNDKIEDVYQNYANFYNYGTGQDPYANDMPDTYVPDYTPSIGVAGSIGTTGTIGSAGNNSQATGSSFTSWNDIDKEAQNPNSDFYQDASSREQQRYVDSTIEELKAIHGDNWANKAIETYTPFQDQHSFTRGFDDANAVKEVLARAYADSTINELKSIHGNNWAAEAIKTYEPLQNQHSSTRGFDDAQAVEIILQRANDLNSLPKANMLPEETDFGPRVDDSNYENYGTYDQETGEFIDPYKNDMPTEITMPTISQTPVDNIGNSGLNNWGEELLSRIAKDNQKQQEVYDKHKVWFTPQIWGRLLSDMTTYREELIRETKAQTQDQITNNSVIKAYYDNTIALLDKKIRSREEELTGKPDEEIAGDRTIQDWNTEKKLVANLFGPGETSSAKPFEEPAIPRNASKMPGESGFIFSTPQPKANMLPEETDFGPLVDDSNYENYGTYDQETGEFIDPYKNDMPTEFPAAPQLIGFPGNIGTSPLPTQTQGQLEMPAIADIQKQPAALPGSSHRQTPTLDDIPTLPDTRIPQRTNNPEVQPNLKTTAPGPNLSIRQPNLTFNPISTFNTAPVTETTELSPATTEIQKQQTAIPARPDTQLIGPDNTITLPEPVMPQRTISTEPELNSGNSIFSLSKAEPQSYLNPLQQLQPITTTFNLQNLIPTGTEVQKTPAIPVVSTPKAMPTNEETTLPSTLLLPQQVTADQVQPGLKTTASALTKITTPSSADKIGVDSEDLPSPEDFKNFKPAATPSLNLGPLSPSSTTVEKVTSQPQTTSRPLGREPEESELTLVPSPTMTRAQLKSNEPEINLPQPAAIARNPNTVNTELARQLLAETVAQVKAEDQRFYTQTAKAIGLKDGAYTRTTIVSRDLPNKIANVYFADGTSGNSGQAFRKHDSIVLSSQQARGNNTVSNSNAAYERWYPNKDNLKRADSDLKQTLAHEFGHLVETGTLAELANSKPEEFKVFPGYESSYITEVDEGLARLRGLANNPDPKLRLYGMVQEAIGEVDKDYVGHVLASKSLISTIFGNDKINFHDFVVEKTVAQETAKQGRALSKDEETQLKQEVDQKYYQSGPYNEYLKNYAKEFILSDRVDNNEIRKVAANLYQKITKRNAKVPDDVLAATEEAFK